MGVLRSQLICEVELDDFCKTLQLSGGVFYGSEGKSRSTGGRKVLNSNEGGYDERQVCVTSGSSLVGSAIANRLLSQGYSVRLTVETQEDVEKVMKFERNNVSVVVADLMNVDSMCEAFQGCSGVFHTSAFIDPSGVSGYTKYMADTETMVAELVIEACVRTESVRKCVFTSSLLACVWQARNTDNLIVDEKCWSGESLCREKKLWYALGKTMAERAAWKAARGKTLKLVTICPAFFTGQANPIAYLKGSEDMLDEGLLATVSVEKVAEAHISVYMEESACGRFICFEDQLISGTLEATQLLSQINRIPTYNHDNLNNRLELSNRKLSKLLCKQRRCSYDTYSSY